MNLDAAQRHAVNLMYLHGLTPEWGFRFDRGTNRHGACHPQSKVISVSRIWAQHNDQEWLTQVMLHEIAHAKVGCSHNHDKVWRAYATMIGYKHDRGLGPVAKGDRITMNIAIRPNLHGQPGTIIKVNRVNLKVELDDGRIFDVSRGYIKPLDNESVSV